MNATEPNANIERNFERELTSIGARLLRAYLECSPDLQEAAREMVAILNSTESDEDERAMALHTLQQIFFPERDDCSATIEHLDSCAVRNQPDGAALGAELDREEATFAERLSALLEQKRISQSELARRAGLGQPAISMMLSRSCRPQRRTVTRLAEALGIPMDELWPDSE